MKITTVADLPPIVMQSFSRKLFDPWGSAMDSWRYKYEKILIKHKNNPGILREFKKLYTILEELYEWYKKEKAYKFSENKKFEKKPMPQISQEPDFPHGIRDIYQEFIQSIL